MISMTYGLKPYILEAYGRKRSTEITEIEASKLGSQK